MKMSIGYFLSFVAAHHQPSIVMISDQGDQTKVITFELRGEGFVPVGVVIDTIDAKNNNVQGRPRAARADYQGDADKQSGGRCC
ncbi:hypothetical protein GQ600_8283 [Phytophthora cactorum]|nr:hypothetical protein GQ600_8283 [Phytophthora cactorum]